MARVADKCWESLSELSCRRCGKLGGSAHDHGLLYMALMPKLDMDLKSRAQSWREQDPDPKTRAALGALLDGNDAEELKSCFDGTLAFGTAGLRGLLGPGPNRMNRMVVLRATAGLCAWVQKKVPNAAERGVCIGYDGRHMSLEFAEDARAVVTGAGMKAHIFEETVATPVPAFAVERCGAAAGIMITASHNPPRYNGYKVYWENSAQIIPPNDVGIAEEIARIESVSEVSQLDRAAAEKQGLVEVLGQDLVREYLDEVGKLQVHPELPRDIGIAYTALHGVGGRFIEQAFADAGFNVLHSVREQAEPDGDFPTVDFPNPEEPGAMDLVLELAGRTNADLILANDPDADRLAVAVRDLNDGFVSLNGNEIGCMLAHYLLLEGEGPKRMVLSSVVSSPMLGAIAKDHGARWEQTLTGFKWIANEAMRLEREDGFDFIMGYEEALGYTVGSLVRDKDGIGAALVMADMAAWCRSRGTTLLEELDRAYRRYGMFLSRQISEVHAGADGPERMAALMDRARERPPSSLGSFAVLAVSDLQSGERRARSGEVSPVAFPKSNVLILDLAEGHRVMIRPSGTEPKVKYYYDVRTNVEESESIAVARKRGEALIDELSTDLKDKLKQR